MKNLRVLIACEYSGTVRDAFAELGHDATSCDLLPTESPGSHYQGDVFDIIGEGWDIMIGFPPCTHLANAGGCHFEQKRADGRQREAILFFQKLLAAPIKRIALENPVGILSSDWYIPTHFPDLLPGLNTVGMPRKPNQVIQPFYFGDPVRKYTCLWTKNLPPLEWRKSQDLFGEPTYVQPKEPTHTMVRKGNYRPGSVRKIYWQEMLPKKDRAKIKAKTFPGIAEAMAKQWSEYVLSLQK